MLSTFLKQPLYTGALLLLLVSLGIILAAIGFEHIGGYTPCPMCLLERKAWYFAAPASAITLLALRINRPQFAKLLLTVIALIFMSNALYAVYHAGIEWKWWQGPSSCTGGALSPLGGGAGGLLEALDSEKVVRCDEAQFRLFGLSFAGYNAIFSLAMVFVSIIAIKLSTRPQG